jgi:hypothetical protein
MKTNYRKILFASLVLCLMGLVQQAQAQPFNNSWINFSNTYYKFKVTSEGIYRIS